MQERKDWGYFTFEVGRYEPEWGDDPKTFQPYKPITNKLVWYVFNEDNGKIIVRNLFDYNWIFLCGLLEAKKKYSHNFIKFAGCVRRWLSHEYWSRAEYETIITSWPPFIEAEELERLELEKVEHESKWGKMHRHSVNLSSSFKLDIYTQIMLNWDRFIEYLWNNKKLITKKKLGLEKVL